MPRRTCPAVFRQRICPADSCRVLFDICSCCDRGHKYCSDPCRDRGLRQKRREANRRHQQSLDGRLDHRDRQRAYRQRRRESVTDNPSPHPPDSPSIAAAQPLALDRSCDQPGGPPEKLHETPTLPRPPRPPGPAPPRCIVCGREGLAVNPFEGWR